MKLDEELIETRVVFAGRYLRAEERRVRLPDGSTAVREIICPPDAVGILALDAGGTAYLVRQYRTALQAVTLEIPAGVIDPGEAPDATAARECAEEIGMRPARLVPICRFYHSVGFSTGQIHLYLADGLAPAPAAAPDPGERLELVRLPFTTLYAMALRGEIVDCKSLLAIHWYRDRIREARNA